MKQTREAALRSGDRPFSILERIDVGETSTQIVIEVFYRELSVSSNGSTWVKPESAGRRASSQASFSILERIDVGETRVPSPVL